MNHPVASCKNIMQSCDCEHNQHTLKHQCAFGVTDERARGHSWGALQTRSVFFIHYMLSFNYLNDWFHYTIISPVQLHMFIKINVSTGLYHAYTTYMLPFCTYTVVLFLGCEKKRGPTNKFILEVIKVIVGVSE